VCLFYFEKLRQTRPFGSILPFYILCLGTLTAVFLKRILTPLHRHIKCYRKIAQPIGHESHMPVVPSEVRVSICMRIAMQSAAETVIFAPVPVMVSLPSS